MNQNEISALIALLDDPNSMVYETVKENLLNIGSVIIPQLEKAWESSLDEKLQQRIENIIQKLQFRETLQNLTDWVNSGDNDLITGASIIGSYQYPEGDRNKIESVIEKIRKDVWLELNDQLTGPEKIRILNHFVFELNSFKRNNANFGSPMNFFINNVIDTRKGNPISLSIIYAGIAQRLNLPVYGVNLPGNFILAYLDEYYLFDRKTPKVNQEHILFYINPFNRGTVFGKKEIDFFIKQQNLKPDDNNFLPQSNEMVIRELVNNLIQTYEKLGYPDKIEDLKQLLSVFEKIM